MTANLRFEIGVELGVIFDLRHRVLRTGKPLDSAHMPGDDAPTTQHLAVWQDETLIGCATLMIEDGGSDAAGCAIRLRGMAVDASVRNRGIGEEMVRFMQKHAAKKKSGLWCHARIKALGVYLRAGMVETGEFFDIPKIGDHRLMVWRP